MRGGEGETPDMATPPLYDVGRQAGAQRKQRRQPPLQETGTDKGMGFGFNLANCKSSN